MQIKLDFNINGSTARMEYVQSYLKDIDPNRLTSDNLEMISNYILWGLQAENPDLDFEIESKNSPWAKSNKTTSLDAMIEQEQETGMPLALQLSDVQVHSAKKKLVRSEVVEKLRRDVQGEDPYEEIAWAMVKNPSQDCFAILGESSRFAGQFNNQTQAECTQSADAIFSIKDWHPLTEEWFMLWQQIDTTEFMVQTWELEHGKRRADLPIRDELHFRLACYLLFSGKYGSLQAFERELLELMRGWEGYQYLKKKRMLVQMRTQQYLLLDNLQGETLMRHMNVGTYWAEPERGIRDFYPFSQVGFLIDGVEEKHFSPKFHAECVRALKRLDEIEENPRLRDPMTIDLRDPDTIRQLLLLYPELDEAAQRLSEVEGATLRALLQYVNYYVQQCDFEPELLFILRAKTKRVSNKDIVNLLQEKYGLNYKENYISTIFTKRIVEAIVEQVNLHYRLIEFITMGNSVFKRCSKCGKALPRNTTYYNRRTSTSDGFFSSCKKCKTRRKD